jgi:hypothetical protein
MKWNTLDHYFCEGSLNGLPEYYNAFSSLFITYFGLLGLYKIQNDLIIQIIYSLLAVNGISSFMYHWTGTIGWALYDEYPMIIALFLGNIYVENLIPSRYKKYKIIFYVNSMLLYLVINVMEDQRIIFPYYFACGLLIVLYNINRLSSYYKRINNNNIKYSYNTNYYSIIIIGSALVWGLTEVSCKHYRIRFTHLYLLGHPMWHFMISYGFYNLINIIYNIKLFLS